MSSQPRSQEDEVSRGRWHLVAGRLLIDLHVLLFGKHHLVIRVADHRILNVRQFLADYETIADDAVAAFAIDVVSPESRRGRSFQKGAYLCGCAESPRNGIGSFLLWSCRRRQRWASGTLVSCVSARPFSGEGRTELRVELNGRQPSVECCRRVRSYQEQSRMWYF